MSKLGKRVPSFLRAAGLPVSLIAAADFLVPRTGPFLALVVGVFFIVLAVIILVKLYEAPPRGFVGWLKDQTDDSEWMWKGDNPMHVFTRGI